MPETVPHVVSPEAVEANKAAYQQLNSLVTRRLDQLPPETLDKLQAISFTLTGEDLPEDQGRTRIDSIRIEPCEEHLRISIRNPLFGRHGLFDLTSEGGCYDRPGQDVWDETKQEVVPRALTASYFGSQELISRLDTYLPVLERLSACAELELPAE